MDKENKTKRIENIRAGLKEVGGVTALARQLGVSRWWIYQVLSGNGTSARVIREAEAMIAERRQFGSTQN